MEVADKLITISVMEVACELAHARVFDEFRDILEDEEGNMYQISEDDSEHLVYKDFIQDRFEIWYNWYGDNLISLRQ
jgi:uncharacterized protein (DUF2249 family)